MPGIGEILRVAREARASDVHLTVGIPPKMRVNGRLIAMNYPKMLPADTLDVVLSVMNEGQRDKFEERGEYDAAVSLPESGRCRVHAYKQKGLAALAFRLVESNAPSAEELGIPETVMELYRKRKGLVLVTGPAGSGKSTTLTAIIDKINNNREAHVVTLEDPIEFLHQHKKSIISQREIGLDSPNYAEALGAALREDVDVILIGELRDFETVSMALTAAENGSLVLAAMHTCTAAETVDRMLGLFPKRRQRQAGTRLAGVMEAVISQQLIPAIDGKCRAAAFEVLHANPAVRDLIREAKAQQLSSIMQAGFQSGMITMDEAIRQLYEKGRISREQAFLFARDPEGMSNKI